MDEYRIVKHLRRRKSGNVYVYHIEVLYHTGWEWVEFIPPHRHFEELLKCAHRMFKLDTSKMQVVEK